MMLGNQRLQVIAFIFYFLAGPPASAKASARLAEAPEARRRHPRSLMPRVRVALRARARWHGRRRFLISRAALSRVPPSECVPRTHAEGWDDEHNPRGRRVDQRIQDVAALDAEHCAAFHKKRHIRTERRGDLVRTATGEIDTPQRRERADRGRRIAA